LSRRRQPKILVILLCSLILFLGTLTTSQGGIWPNPPPNYMSVLYEGGDYINTVDPVWWDGRNTGMLIFNVMEPLIFFEGERIDRFHGALATEVYIGPPAPGSPIYTNHTYYFKIRENVPFHTYCKNFTWDQYYVTSYDVEYSFERLCVVSPKGYLHWMLFEAVFGGYYDPDPADPVIWGLRIDHAFESNATHFWINVANKNFTEATGTVIFPLVSLLPLGPDSPGLPQAIINYPVEIFLQLISLPLASILSHDWIVDWVNPNAVASGLPQEWDGNWGDYTDWINYHNPLSSTLDRLYGGVMCGTGPFWLLELDRSAGFTLYRFEDYWGGWPASWPSPPYPPHPSSGVHPMGYINNFTYRREYNVTKRIEDLKNGICDFADIPKGFEGPLHVNGDRNGPTVDGIERVRLKYPAITWESLRIGPLVTFNFYFRGATLPAGYISPTGVPPDFFNNTHCRRAFAYCINYTGFIKQFYYGEASQPTCAPLFVQGVIDSSLMYRLDPAKAEEEFRKAIFLEWPTGIPKSVWDVGFNLTIYYPEGDPITEFVCRQLEDVLESLNPNFTVNVNGAAWMVYISLFADDQLPIATHLDLQGFYGHVHYYLTSLLIFTGSSWFVGYNNPAIKELLNQHQYDKLQQIYFEDCPMVAIAYEIVRHYERSWMNGWFENPDFPGVYAYTLWKWNYIPGDVNRDGKVDMIDIGLLCDAFGTYGWQYDRPPHPKWNFWCDQDGCPQDGWRDNKIDMRDIVIACSNFGKSIEPWYPPPSPPPPQP